MEFPCGGRQAVDDLAKAVNYISYIAAHAGPHGHYTLRLSSFFLVSLVALRWLAVVAHLAPEIHSKYSHGKHGHSKHGHSKHGQSKHGHGRLAGSS